MRRSHIASKFKPPKRSIATVESDENTAPNTTTAATAAAPAAPTTEGLVPCWKVILAKSHLKRRCFSDGFLVLADSGKHYLLRDGSHAQLGKLAADPATVQVDAEFEIGAYVVQVEHPMQLESKPQPPRFDLKKRKASVVEEQEDDEEVAADESSKSAAKLATKVARSRPQHALAAIGPLPPATLDPSIAKLMRPHQLAAAEFLLGRLNQDTGAILADEMGLGKSLTSLAVSWAFLRRHTSKAVIVCPSSLVLNWRKEIKKWLGIRVNPLVVETGPKSNTVVDDFVAGAPNVFPVLVISYEMFRKHAPALNDCGCLDVLICDEGHRLKNAYGSKTMTALLQCPATKRIVLTGTPIQNDLDELFAVANFASPSVLGSLGEFRRDFIRPITDARRREATAAQREAGRQAALDLHARLAQFMLRRTQHDVLRHVLPPRTDLVVFCHPSAEQLDHYQSVVQGLQAELGTEDASFADDTDEGLGDTVSLASVLPVLIQLRKACNFVKADETSGPEGVHSSKFEVILQLVNALRQKQPAEKIVCVSNFTSTLDVVQQLLESRGHSFLRLDGSVPSDKRQSIVDRFNWASDQTDVFLLSSKAGGVGLNLVGASRLIMCDVDWNPATDKQAMSRIWRDGQTKPVVIYRLVGAGTIEEAILQRQYQKDELNSVMQAVCSNAAAVRTLTKRDVHELVRLRWDGNDGAEKRRVRCDTLQKFADHNGWTEAIDHVADPVIHEVVAKLNAGVVCHVHQEREKQEFENLLDPEEEEEEEAAATPERDSDADGNHEADENVPTITVGEDED